MTVNTVSKDEMRLRTALLKRLREEHAHTVERTRERLKEQKGIRQQICQTLRDGPRTVPEIAKATGLPADNVLWHIMAMKKYDLVIEDVPCGEYYMYKMAREDGS